MSRNQWPLLAAIAVALAVGGGIVAHRMSKPPAPAAQEGAAEPDAADEDDGPAVELVARPTSARVPGAAADDVAADLEAVAGKLPPKKLVLPRRFLPKARSPLYHVYPAAGRRAEKLPRGPDVRRRWYEGASDHKRALREMRKERADMLVYFYTDW